MEKEWKSPKTIIGAAATGEFYFPRTSIVNEIWDELDKGNFILIAAPRRVGKTSIMRDLEKNPKAGYLVKFESVQAIRSEMELYRSLYQVILSCLNSKHKVKGWFKKYLQTKTITEIDVLTGKFKLDSTEFNYKDEITNLLNEFKEEDEKVVLLIDELPEVLHELNKNGKKEEAKSILKQLRVWRQGNYKNLQLVIAGSIEIHYVVKTIEGRTSDLNDLKQINCEPLSENQPENYIQWATKEATVLYDSTKTQYLKDKIKEYYTPYFINLMLDEVNKIARKEGKSEITTDDIDSAFEKIIKTNDHFQDWKTRLSEYLPKEDFKFVNEVLKHIAHKEDISIQKIYDIATKHDKIDDYMELIGELENDGYIVEKEEAKHVFLSPFLKAFWKRNNPIYNG